MITLSYTVAGQLIEPASVPQYLVADTVGVYQVAFTFDADWADMGEKTVVFRNPQVIDPDYRDVPVEFPLDANGQALVPAALLDPGKLFIGVYGTNSTQQLPTIWAPPLQVVPGASPGVEPSDDPALGSVIRTIPQTLTDEEKAQARENIGANEVAGGTPGNVVIIGSNENIADSGMSKDNLILSPQLSSHIYAEDQTPYLYRQTGGGVEAGTREYDSIVGGSVVNWQKFCPIVNSKTYTLFGVTITCTDGRFNVSGAANGSGGRTSYWNDRAPIRFVKNHKYYIQVPTELPAGLNITDGSTRANVASNVRTGIREWTLDTLENGYFVLNITNGITYDASGYCMVYDLTERFGPAVADRLLAMETASAGSGIAVLNAMGLNQYRPCTAEPSLLSAMPTAHIMRDEEDNIIGNYPLAGIELRGVPAVDSAGNIYFDGDTYAPDGTVVRRYGIVDLGTLNWAYASAASDTRFYTTSIDCNAPTSSAVTMKAVCALYATVPYNQVNGRVSNDMVMGAVKSGSTVYFAIKNLSYTSAAAFKTAMSGVYMIYELATPTVETAAPYDALQVCDPLGTEEYVDERAIPVPVGHVTKYPVDQVRKLDGLPSDFTTLLAYKENEFKATRTYTKYDFITINNVLYEVTATTIASGTTLTIGSNITQTTVGNVLKQILSSI